MLAHAGCDKLKGIFEGTLEITLWLKPIPIEVELEEEEETVVVVDVTDGGSPSNGFVDPPPPSKVCETICP